MPPKTDDGVDYETDTALHAFLPSVQHGDDLCARCGEHESWHPRTGLLEIPPTPRETSDERT